MNAKEVYDEIDAATRAVECYSMTNHYAYLKWPAEDRLNFDRGYRAARERLQRALEAREQLIQANG